jgi:hypothetical protein
VEASLFDAATRPFPQAIRVTDLQLSVTTDPQRPHGERAAPGDIGQSLEAVKARSLVIVIKYHIVPAPEGVNVLLDSDDLISKERNSSSSALASNVIYQPTLGKRLHHPRFYGSPRIRARRLIRMIENSTVAVRVVLS